MLCSTAADCTTRRRRPECVRLAPSGDASSSASRCFHVAARWALPSPCHAHTPQQWHHNYWSPLLAAVPPRRLQRMLALAAAATKPLSLEILPTTTVARQLVVTPYAGNYTWQQMV